MTTPSESAVFNKSELVRKVYREHPWFSNAEIRESVKLRWNVGVKSNLIIQAIGRERDRVSYLASHATLQQLASKFLADCGGNLSVAINHLRLAY